MYLHDIAAMARIAKRGCGCDCDTLSANETLGYLDI